MTERSCNDGHVPREGYVPEDGRCTEEYLACVRENYFDVSGWSGYVPRSAEQTESR
mgnify:CR=1 FL=1